MEKLEEIERAAYEVQLYENRIEVLTSVHKEYSREIDWNAWVTAPEPQAPERTSSSEAEARKALRNYQPGFLDRILKREETRRTELETALAEARHADEVSHQKALRDWSSEYQEWEESRDLAKRVVAGDQSSWIESIEKLNPFSDISELGSALSFRIGESGVMEVTLHVHGEDVVPKEIKSQLKSGRLSTKKMPTSKFNELFQDYVCSCILRVASEIFAILPIDDVLVNAVDRLLDTQTGHIVESPILSVFIPRATLKSLNMNNIDPSDSMKNFVHRMNFKKTKGFARVGTLTPVDFKMED